ncbi:MAG: c-type cytochrome, partial [SAR202 cluster bacterium]|nr:c-type cytochrome [SAR202 cluster bacterium]
AAFRWVWAAVIGDWLHLIAVATWAGALPCLLIAVVVIARGAEGARRRRLLVETVSRFSGVAVAAVVVIALTGVFSAYLHVGSFGAAASGYGLALIVKTTLFGGVLTAAGVNLLVVRPRLKASGRGQSPEGGTARRLRLALMVETALAVFVIGASGFLASMDTARRLEGAENVGTAASFRRESGGLSLWLRVSYLGGGQHRIAVTASEGPRGVIAVDRAVVRLRYLVRDVGESEVVLPQRGEGYEAQGLLLPLAGMWQIDLLPLRSGPAAPERFRVTVVASGLVYPTAEEVAQDAAGRAVPLALAGMVLAIALAGVFRAGMLPRRQRRQAAFTALGSVCVGVVGMAALVGQVNAMRGHTDVPLVSPFPATTGSVVAGEALYERHCVVCHGVSGRGDGPAAAGLSPRPADLPVHVPLHSDRQLYVWISEGLPGTAMPAFRDNLRPEERWHLLNYLKKQFAPQDR